MTQDSLKAQLSQKLIAEPPQSIGGILDKIYEVLLPLAKDVVRQNKEVILAAYDEATRMIDLPGPQFIENRIEGALRSALESWIDSL